MMNVWHRKGPVQIGVLQDSLCGRCFVDHNSLTHLNYQLCRIFSMLCVYNVRIVVLEFYTKSTETARTVRMLCTIEQPMHEYPIH